MTLSVPKALRKIAQCLSGVEDPRGVSCKPFGATPGNDAKPGDITIQWIRSPRWASPQQLKYSSAVRVALFIF